MENLNENKKVIKLDFTGCKTGWEYHERIRKAFDFPEWYGKNWSAFSDLLWSECDADKIEIRGEQTISLKFSEHIRIMHEIIQKEKLHRAQYGEKFEYEIID